MFKKVIGQEASDSQKPSQSTSEERSPSVATSSRDSSSPESQRGSAPPAPSRQSGGNTRNVLSSDVEIKGTVKFQDDLIVDGKIEGDIQSTGNLTVGENARLKAEIKTGTVVIYGKVHGNITANERIELKSSAEVVGDIKTKTLTIEAGAIFVGKSTVGTPSEAQASPSSSPQPESKPAQGSSSSSRPAMAGK